MNSKLSTSSMSQSTSVLCLLLVGLLVLFARVEGMTLIEQVDQSSAGSGGKAAATLAVIENPELVSRVLESLLRSIVYSASMEMATVQSTQKRGLDLGISRGFSGSQAGKHLMGLSAASFANGPGRR